MSKPLSAAVLALSLFAGAASAQATGDVGGYALGAFGKSSYDTDCTDLVSCDKSGSFVKAGAGYRYANGLAAEALLMNFGTTSAIDPDFFGAKLEAKLQAIGIGAALRTDLSPMINATLRIGLASVKTTATVSLGGQSGSQSDSKIKPYYGVALGYKLTPKVWIEAAFDGTSGEVEGDDGRVGAFSIGVGLKF